MIPLKNVALKSISERALTAVGPRGTRGACESSPAEKATTLTNATVRDQLGRVS
jgi:hypothetical protein